MLDALERVRRGAPAAFLGVNLLGRSTVDQILVASSVETQPYSGIFDAATLAESITIAHDID